MLNRVTLIGNVGPQAPTLKATQKGGQVGRFRCVTTERWSDKSGAPHERQDWHSVVVWGNKAETVGQLSAGEPIYVEGKLQTRSYEQNNEKKWITEVVVDFGGRVISLNERPPVRTQQAYAPSAARSTPSQQQPRDFNRGPFDDEIPF